VRERECGEDRSGDRACLAKHLIVPETQHSETLAAQEGVAADVILIVSVLRAVRLHDQALRKTREVDDVRLDYLLPPELEGCKPPVAKQRP
jgi:hypothetical protein